MLENLDLIEKNKMLKKFSEEGLCLKIKNLRISLNMSQERFGKKIGVTGKSISAYERGACTPPLKVLEKMSDTYDTGFFTITNSNKQLLSEKLTSLKELIYELERKIFM